MKINKIPYIAMLACGLFGTTLSSCTKDFDKLSTDPEASAQIQPGLMFSKAQYDGAKNNLNLLLGTMQYTTSFNDVAGFGSKYVSSQSQQSSAVFSNAYFQEINELALVIGAVKDDAEKVNLLSAARIWRAYCYSRITDLYGDIPYSEAATGYTAVNYKPKYDSQQSIYADMLKELDEAATSFNTAKPETFGTADLIYGGNIDKWKKFAYSMMLRLGMRMTKVDVNLAETWVRKAIAGGVITSDADIAKINYLSTGQDINKNPIALNLYNSDYVKANGVDNTEGGKYQDVFINQLKTNKDPRLGIFSVVWVKPTPASAAQPDTAFAVQKGMPATLNAKPSDFVTYSEPNLKTVVLLSGAKIIFGTAETNFLLAEAALRGWYSGSITALYESGITSAMKQWAIISPTDGIISDLQINTYIKYHKLNPAGDFSAQMNQIYTEFWLALFPDAQEAFSSYRRTGFPALIPVNYVGNATGGKIFRRMLYPLAEQNLNRASLDAAIARQGADDFMTRIWWDKTQ